jgi:hypothetical protein
MAAGSTETSMSSPSIRLKLVRCAHVRVAGILAAAALRERRLISARSRSACDPRSASPC